MLFTAAILELISPQMGVCSYRPEKRWIANLQPATPQYEATGKLWFQRGETLSVNGGIYAREGEADRYYNTYFHTVAERDGIPIFTRQLGDDRPQRVYVMVKSRNCLFQAYVLR